jgi:hypothetical protein
MKDNPQHRPVASRKSAPWWVFAAVAAVAAICATIVLLDGDKPPAATSLAERITPRPDAALAETGLRPRTKVPGEPQDRIRPGLATALGHGGERPTASRILQLMDTRDSLNREEIDELLRAMLTHGEGWIAARSTWFHEIANLVHSQEHDKRSFAEVLATVARDSTRDLATRDYALQQLRRVWAGSGQDHSLRRAIEETFIEMNVAENPLRATALLSLHLLEEADVGSRASQSLRQSVVSILGGSDTSAAENVPVRMVAARIAGERKIHSMGGDLLMIASSDREHALVRMSAASALSDMGPSSELDALSDLNPADRRVAAAIRHATRDRPGR